MTNRFLSYAVALCAGLIVGIIAGLVIGVIA